MSGPANHVNVLRLDPELDSQLNKFREAFGAFEPYVRKKYLGAAVRFAARPTMNVFKSLIPVGPTGNLKESATMVVRNYKYTSVAVVGYAMQQRWTGGDSQTQGWHQGFIEFGTKDRKIEPKNGTAIASSRNKRGPFTIINTDPGFTTDPPYPFAFFKRAKRGETLQLARSPRGGIRGVEPLIATWDRDGQSCKHRLLGRMEENLVKAVAETARRARRGLDRS